MSTQKSQAQISYSQDFEGDVPVYDVDGFDLEFLGYGCQDTSLYTNIWYDDPYTYELISTSIGVSNGQASTFTYDYKILAYEDFSALPNNPDWGNFKWEFSTDPTGPWTEIETVTAANHVESENCVTRTVNLPSSPVGSLYLRLTARVNEDNMIDAFIFFDNLTFNQDPSPACTGTPAVSNVLGGSECTFSETVLSLDQFYTASEIAYQWQSSTDGTTFTNIAGADGAEYTATVPATTEWYRAVITCTASGLSTTTAAVSLLGTGLCYCTPDFTSAVEPITSVVFAGIDNTTSEEVDATEPFEDFTTTIEPAQVTKGQTYTISAQGNTDGEFTNYFTVYFDFNANGRYTDAGEEFQFADAIFDSTGTDGQTVTASITIPATATVGTTRFRVFKRYNAYPDTSCGTYGYGQVEEYAVTIAEDTNSAGGFSKANFKYSPNPVANELNLQYNANLENVQVMNMLGQTVLTKNNIGATDTKLDMSGLQAGTYLVKVGDAQGASMTVKVVKQ
nr:T9SS type A sorting domain-containing protein [uncultured Flavobacterium sp.]